MVKKQLLTCRICCVLVFSANTLIPIYIQAIFTAVPLTATIIMPLFSPSTS